MLEDCRPFIFLRHDFKWVPRSHMYKTILKLKKLTNIVLKNNAKNGKRGLESYYNLFYYQLSSSAGLTLLRSHPSSMKGVLNFAITDPIDSQFC